MGRLDHPVQSVIALYRIPEQSLHVCCVVPQIKQRHVSAPPPIEHVSEPSSYGERIETKATCLTLPCRVRDPQPSQPRDGRVRLVPVVALVGGVGHSSLSGLSPASRRARALILGESQKSNSLWSRSRSGRRATRFPRSLAWSRMPITPTKSSPNAVAFARPLDSSMRTRVAPISIASARASDSPRSRS